MSENTFSPRSRAQDEREILKQQTSFESGTFKDIPASNIPEDGMVELVNMLNYGDRLEGRPGTRLWGDYSTSTQSAELPTTEDSITYTDGSVTSGERTIVRSSGTFTSSNVGDYFVLGGSVHERIIEYVSSSTVKTQASNTTTTTGTGSIRGRVNGLFFHSRDKKIVIHIGEELYISNDHTMTSWTKALNESITSITNTVSRIDEVDRFCVIFNSSGIYKLDLSDSNPYKYYQMNAAGPTEFLSKISLAGIDYIIKRRHTYTFVKLDGDGAVYGNRLTDGVNLIQESSCLKSEVFQDDGGSSLNKIQRDYTEQTDDNTLPSRSSSTIWDNLQNEFNSTNDKYNQQWTHYGVYCTLDISENGIDPISGKANNTEIYIWVNDIAMMKPYYGDMTIPALKFITESDPTTDFDFSDAGSYATVYDSNDNRYIEEDIAWFNSDGSISISINKDIPNTVLAVGGEFRADNPESARPYIGVLESKPINPFVGSITGDTLTMTTPTAITDTFTVVAATDICTATAHGFYSGQRFQFSSTTTLPDPLTIETDYWIEKIDADTFYIHTTYYGSIEGLTDDLVDLTDTGTGTHTMTQSVLSDNDNNKLIACSNGNFYHIKTVDTFNDSATLWETGISATGTVGFVMDAKVRAFSNSYSDDTLRGRIESGDPFYYLQTRYYEPLPSSNVGEAAAGFVFTTTEDDHQLYYSSMPDGFQYLGGSYHPAWQTARFKGAIRDIRELPDRLVVYLSNSTYVVPLNTFNEQRLEGVGNNIPIIAGQNVMDQNIGIFDKSGVSSMNTGKHIVITNEPGIRVFDGNGYSENIASRRLINELKSFTYLTHTMYDPNNGLYFWGSTEVDNLLTNKSFRLGLEYEHGVGFSENTGGSWPFPEVQVGSLRVIDSENRYSTLVLDHTTGVWHDITTEERPTNSNIFRVYTDGVAIDGTPGTDIEPMVKFREHTGTLEKYFIEHLGSNFYLRPRLESRRSVTEHGVTYDSNGYPSGIEFYSKIYADGQQDTEVADAENIGLKHNIVYDRKVEAHRLQTEFGATKSDFILNATDIKYIAKDKPEQQDTIITTEGDYQEDLAPDLFWFSRGKNLDTDRI